MNRRRLFTAIAAAATVAAGLTVTTGTARAWSLSIGGSERVDGNGVISSERRDVGAFDAIALSGNFTVQVRPGTSEKVEVKTDGNLQPYLETRVVEGGKGRTLEIAPRKGYQLSARQTPIIMIDVRSLRALSIAGSGDMRVEGVKTPALDASIAGSGDIRLDSIDAGELSLRVAGSGDVTARGRAQFVSIGVAGSGDVRARELTAEDGKVTIAGSGDVTVHAQRKLTVKITGSGDVGYVGTPELTTSAVGSGRVRKLND